MATATLPANLRTKLDLLARRLHRLRLLRGGSFVVLAVVVGAGIALGLDAWLDLPPYARIVLFAGWLFGISLVAWRELIQPLRRPVTAAGLAAAVEEEYPRLDERLTTAVELADCEVTHGSPAFIGMLVRETESRTRSVDFLRAAPPHAAEWLTAVAIAAVLLVAAPVVFWPDNYLGLGRRLFMPWDRRPAVMPFAVVLTPGNAFAARGRPLTIGVELQPTREGVAIPEVCTLVLTAGDGKPLRLRMPSAGRPHAFAFRIDAVTGAYRYYIETGAVETDTHTITAVDAVELAGGPIATLTPPLYAKALGSQTVEGLAELTVLEHGRVAIDCRFDRPAAAATLLFTPLTPGAATERKPLKFAADARSGQVELPARITGRLQLELLAEHGITTVTPEQSLTVTPDRPPQFRRVAGLPDRADTRPTDALALDVAVADDLAVAAVEIEYRVNEGPVQREPLALAGLGSPAAGGRRDFKLAGKIKDGDRLFVRLRAADNRNVPEANVGPNVVTYPADDRWCELRVTADAGPLRQQEITAKRDDIEKRLRDLIAQINQTIRRTYALHQNIDQGRATADDQTKALGELTDEQSKLTKLLMDLTRDAEVAGLKPLADKMQAVGEQEFRQATEAFGDAGRAADQPRLAALRRADAALTDARNKLDALSNENRELAAARLDEVQLSELAERERELAEQAKKAETPAEREAVAAEQQRIAEELEKLTESNDRLRDALQSARAEEAGKLAEQAKQLAQAERDLDAKLKEAERQRNIGRLADLAKKQQELAAEADRLAKQTRDAAQTAKTQPLDAEPAAKAADDLRAGDADAAQRRQDQSARELDRLAESLKRGVETATDPREAAKQLSKLQEENRQRLRNKAAERPVARNQQEAIQKAIEKLQTPADNPAANRDRQQAAQLAAEAARALTGNDAGNADFRMSQTKDALDRLVNDLPTAENRMRRARDEVAKLRETQTEIGKQADAADRAAEKGDAKRATEERATAARKQTDVADRLSKLDAPGQDARRDRAAQAAARARDDLKTPGSPDVAADQQEARRTLERLAEALAGKPPADEKARDLARQEREIAAADPAAQRELEKKQEQIALDAMSLNATEAPVRQAEAGQAAIRANAALREKPSDPATRQKLNDAAEALDLLADQLAGRESEAQRADRLARKQEAAVQQPPPNALESRRLANQIADEAKQIRAGAQAAAAKRQATDAMSQVQKTAPGTPENVQAQKQAAQSLRRLADQMKQQPVAPPPTDAAKRPPETSPIGVPTAGQAQQARDLAKQQRDLRDLVRQATAGDRPDPADQEAADKAQHALAEKAGDLAKSLDQTGGAMTESQAREAAQRAAAAARDGEQSLRQAQGGETARSKQARQKAAEALDKAAEQAKQASESGRRKASPNGKPEDLPPEAGQSLQDAKGEMSQAQSQLGKGQGKQAGGSMDKAADALGEAAKRVSQRTDPSGQRDGATRPAETVANSGAPPTSGALPQDVQRNAGKKWGELPGELRTRIIQEMKTQYGDDYARVIKLYFEQVAETNGKK
jgi:hypothetical protein